MFDLVANAAESTAPATGAGAGGGIGMTVMYIVVMVAIFYFLLIRPQKKQEKQKKSMLSDLRPGDEIVSIGGIMGRIVSIKEESVLMETGSDRTKLRLEKSAIKEVLTVHDDAPEETPAKANEKKSQDK